ncbi:MAG: sugar transferase [Bacteroidota bacterium]
MSYRIRDIALASLGLIMFAPLMVLIMIGLWLSQGNVFFRQKRPGLHEKSFVLIKFSTLYDIMPGEEEAANQQARLTPLGKILRKLSLDELPQLINVVKGDMALVGPRPLLMAYLPLYTSEERKRHEVLPGITGWAQVNGRNQISFKEKFAYDLWYIQNRSHGLDLKIMVMTIGKVFRREGVYQNTKTTAEKFDGSN